MRYRLRTLLTVLALGPPVLAIVIAGGMALLDRREDTFRDALHKAGKALEGLDIPDEPPMLSLPAGKGSRKRG